MRIDHKLHFAYGALTAALLFDLLGLFSSNVWLGLGVGFIGSVLVGLGKEILDKYRNNGSGFDNVDLMFTCLGGLAFCGFIAIANLLLKLWM